MVVIYKGDDTDFAGLQEIKISIKTKLDLAEYRGLFDFLGVERVFNKGDLTDKIVTVSYTADETEGFCLGQNYGTFTLWDEKGRRAAVCKILVSVVSHCLCAGMPENAVEISIENAYDYNKLENLPTINGVEVKGGKTGHDYHLQKILPFTPEWTYEKGDQCIYGDVIYLCVRDIPEPKPWDGNDWLCISNGDRSVVTVDELPPTGVPDVIYIVRGTGLIYTWDGEKFVALGRNHAPLLFWNGGESEGGSGTSSGESGYDAYDGAEERVIPMSAEGVAGLVKTADSVVSESAQKQGTAASPAAVRKILAPDFDPETIYFCGQAVIHEGKYYICTVRDNDGRQGPWDPNDFRDGTVEMAREAGIPEVNKVPVRGRLDGHDLNLANLADLFPAFDAAKEYICGQWVRHLNKFYRFTKDHAAGTAWDADEVEPFETVADALEAVDAESKSRDAELDDRKRDYDDLSYNTKIEVPVWNFSFRTEGEPSRPDDAAVLYFDDTTSIPDVLEVWKGTSDRGTETSLGVNLQGGDSVIQYGTVISTMFSLPEGEEHFELRRGQDPTFILTGDKGTGEKIVGEDTIALKSEVDRGLGEKRDKTDLTVYEAGPEGSPVPTADSLAKSSEVALDPIFSPWGIPLLPLSQTTKNALYAVDVRFSANGYAYSLKDNFTSFYIGAVKVLDLSENGMSLRAVSAPQDNRVAEILTWLTQGTEIAAKTVIGYEPHGQSGKQMPNLRARRVIIGDNARVDSGVDNAVDFVAIGKDARIGGNSTMAVGNSSHAGGDNSAAIGPNANAEADNDLVVGGNAAAHGTQALAVGNNAQAQGYSTAVGQGAEAATDGTAVGFQAKTYTPGTAIGSHAEVHASEGVAIGHNAFATAGNAGQIGSGTNALPNSLKYRDTYIVGTDGKIPSASLDKEFREKIDLDVYVQKLYWDVEWEKNGQKETYRLAPVIPAPAPYVSQYLYEGTRDETEFKIRISFRTNGVSVQIYNIRTANQWYSLTPSPNPFADEAGATWGASTTSSGGSHTFRGLGVSALDPTGDTIAKTSEVALKRDYQDITVGTVVKAWTQRDRTDYPRYEWSDARRCWKNENGDGDKIYGPRFLRKTEGNTYIDPTTGADPVYTVVGSSGETLGSGTAPELNLNLPNGMSFFVDQNSDIDADDSLLLRSELDDFGVASVNGKKGDVNLTGDDIPLRPPADDGDSSDSGDEDVPTVAQAVEANSAAIAEIESALDYILDNSHS